MDSDARMAAKPPPNAPDLIPATVIERLLKSHLYSAVLSGRAALSTLLRRLLTGHLPLQHLIHIQAEGRQDSFRLYSFREGESDYAPLYRLIRRYLMVPQSDREQNIALLLRQLDAFPAPPQGPPPASEPLQPWLCYPLSRLGQGWVLLQLPADRHAQATTMLQLIEMRLLALSSERQLQGSNQRLGSLREKQAFQQQMQTWFEQAIHQPSLQQACTDLLLALRTQHPQWAFYVLDETGALLADTPEMEAYSQWQPLCRQLDRYYYPLTASQWIDPPELHRLLHEQEISPSALPARQELERFHWLALPLHQGQHLLAMLVAWSPQVRPHQHDRQHFDAAGRWLTTLLQVYPTTSPSRTTLPDESAGAQPQPLTLMLAHLQQVCAHLRRHPQHLYALIYLGLKQAGEAVTTVGGHAERLRQEVTSRLRGCLRSNDLLCHYRGNDFLILIDTLREYHDAEEIVRRLLELFQRQFHLGPQQLMLSCNIGVAMLTTEQPPEQQIHQTKAAMRRARRLPHRHYLFTDELENKHLNNEQEQAILIALQAGRLIPFFQPVIRLRDRQLVGFEVVARWQHDDSWEEAKEFIHTTERSGLVVQLDYEMVRQGHRYLAQWLRLTPNPPPLGLTLNLSGRHLSSPSAMAQLIEVTAQERQEKISVSFEFTEPDCLRYNGEAMESLKLARQAGIRVGLDDFGTGPSSLKALFNYPIDYIKVDQSFTKGMLNSHRNLALIRAIRDISHDLGFEVVVEGIETARQLQQLQTLGCEYGQGYFIAPPLSPADAGKLLAGE